VHPPRPIDPALGPAFRVSEARQRGTTPARLRTRDLQRPFHGVRTTRELERVTAYVPLLRAGDRFSHTTAAAIWGAPLPRSGDDRIHVTATSGQRPRTTGCIGHESTDPGFSVRSGVPVSTPAQLFAECGTILGLDELVAVADHLLLDPRVLDPRDLRPHATRAQLTEHLDGIRAPGVRRARRALALAREGVESPMETRLRLLLHRAGFPSPECGFELTRPRGRSVGWFDLAWPEARVLVEYDGDQHRTSTRQYEKDIRRFDDAAELGWRVIRVRSRGILITPTDTVTRVARALGFHPSRTAVTRRG
jgi:hypothetical protein